MSNENLTETKASRTTTLNTTTRDKQTKTCFNTNENAEQQTPTEAS